MAPSRGKGKARAVTSALGSRRTPRSTRKIHDGVPDVYQDMLAEASAVESEHDISERPLKKRRVATTVSIARLRKQKSPDVENDGNIKRHRQTVEDSSPSEDENESDFGFEDVDLDQPIASSPGPIDAAEDDIADISISVDPRTTAKSNTATRRKPASPAEKSFRLMVHKAHVLCLLGHCIYVNGWCNNEVVRRHLKSLLPKKTLSYLNPNAEDSQFQRNRSFLDGLLQASEAFRGQFRVAGSGFRRAKWEHEEGPSELDEVMDRAEFIAAAKSLEGSQDTGSQLFCALLRSAGVEARLVCSLQPLPFANAPVKSSTPQKLGKSTVYAMASGTDSPASDSNVEDGSVQHSASIGKVPSARRRLGQPSFAPEPAQTVTPTKKKITRKLAYPIFWTEAFNRAHQKWVPVDPIVTQSVNKPSRLEPPSSYEHNQLSYVIAFESDGVARDVTRRYAKSYNAKTRRHRVESTPDGAAWMKKALRIFRRPRRDHDGRDQDQIEDAELAQKEAREGLPANVQDFKEHPYYALERHLRRHETLHPRREVGKFNAGTAAKPRMEAVFRRQDVCVCRSAEKWFRVGREVQEGEQPVKRAPARRPRRPDADIEGGVEDGKEMVALYTEFQTQLYIPQPVVNGKVPRNAYGNLDIYVPSMVPAGGAHVRHALGKEAARVLKLDHVDAVTGFQFKGRQGTAIIEGVIVAGEYADAVRAVVDGLQDGQVEDESRERSAVALRMWKRFLTGLRIAERVQAYGDSGKEEDVQELVSHVEDAGGGFLPSEMVAEEALPTAGRFSLVELSTAAKPAKRVKKSAVKDESDSQEEEYVEEDRDENHDDVRQPTARTTRASRKIVEEESEDDNMPDHGSSLLEQNADDAGNGFVPDENIAGSERGRFGAKATGTPVDNGDGGFLPEEDQEDNDSGGGFLVENPRTQDGDGDGFVSTDAEMDVGEGGGGFLLEDDMENPDEAGVACGLTVDDSIPGQQVLADESEISAMTDIDRRSVADNLGHTAASNNGTLSQVVHTFVENETLDDGVNVGDPSYSTYQSTCQEEGTEASKAVSGMADGAQGKPRCEGSKSDTLTAAAAAAGVESKQQSPQDIDEEEESDRGSMLSHDPEDEDAEPDWLESD